MIKKLFAVFLALFTAMAFAAVDANRATPAELDGIKGIGPAISGKIVEERGKAPFKNWQDMIDRVKGVGEVNAAKFSESGLTVNGTTFTGTPVKVAGPAAKADVKKDTTAPAAAVPATKADIKADTKAAPAAAATPTAQPTEKMSAADKKAAAAKEKADRKAAARQEKADKTAAKKAAADDATKAKVDKAAAAKAAKEAKSSAAAPAASAAKSK